MGEKPGYRCGCCGEWHDELPRAFGSRAPDAWFEPTFSDRLLPRSYLSSDQCVIKNQHFFVLGSLEIPVDDGGQLVFTVWSSLSEKNFERACMLWNMPGRETEPPYFGWLCNSIPGFGDFSQPLKLNVHTRKVGLRPYLEVEPTSHPLAVAQRDGISYDRMIEVVSEMMHQHHKMTGGE